MHSPLASHSGGTKRAYQADELPALQPHQSNSSGGFSPPASAATTSSAFRNVSACNRCRLRKNRCDQRLPACTACEKARVRCVGYDPITKREIPRSYVYYLETRLSYFESLLVSNDIPFKPAEAYDADSKVEEGGVQSPSDGKSSASDTTVKVETDLEGAQERKKQEDAEKLSKLVSNIGMVSVQGASDPRFLGSTSGISFARVVFAAVKSSVSTNNSERGGIRPSKPLPNPANSGSSSMRDSFFGLQAKPTFKQAPFPDRQLGEKLVHLYFEHANPQIPVLHRGEFMELFERAYSIEHRSRTSRELYMLNIVFAIGAGIIFGSSDPEPASASQSEFQRDSNTYHSKRAKLSSQQQQPEEYHASAIVHLESFLGSPTAADRPDGFGGGLEELQAVLLLAGFALLRPVAPGLWYIVGVAVRLGVDLGLHYEDGSGLDAGNELETIPPVSQDVAMGAASGTLPQSRSIDPKERGRREWVRDLRRRLWWCVYTFDRLVSTCVGRPFGITDQVITTEFPSILDDDYITKSGFLEPPSPNTPSYKHVSHHYFRLRLLQSEILQVLQHQQAQAARRSGANIRNEYMHTSLPSPFLVSFDNNFRLWRKDIDRRLWEWKQSAPYQQDTGVDFKVHFLELNYWQAVIMLYRQSLSVPEPLAQELSPTEDVSSPSSVRREEREDEDDVFLKVAEAGQKVLKLYRQLHRVKLVNYTYLATHHLFMAGISFLYAVWHSATVRSRLTLDDVDFTVLAATSVLGDLMQKCPPAEACRDAFERMSKATVQMCMSTTGFGFGQDRDRPDARSRPSLASTERESTSSYPDPTSSHYFYSAQAPSSRSKRPPPKFDMNLRDLFPEEIDTHDLPSQSVSMFNPPGFRREQSFEERPSQDAVSTATQAPHTPMALGMNSQINAGLGMGGNNNQSGQATQYYNPPQQQTPFYNSSLYGSDFVGMPNMDFLNTAPGDDFNTDMSGIDLGLGMGTDFQHDWNDGTQYDLFDGFFFGNGNGGGLSG